MLDEQRQSSEITLRDYVDLLRRRRSIIIQTFVLVVTVGVIVTFMTKPLFRTGTRILVEGKSYYVSQFSQNDPMSSLFTADVGHEVDTQLGIIQGEKVLNETFTAAGVPNGSVAITAKQEGTTDLIDITAESNDKAAAQKVANTLPGIYLNYVTGNRRKEVHDALEFSKQRLKEETDKLHQAEQSLQQFREKSKVVHVDTERTQRITDKVQAEAELRKAEASLKGLHARMDALVAARKAEPAFRETVSFASNSSQIQLLKDQIDQLKVDRQELLTLYKANYPDVKKLDAKIAGIQERIAKMPPMTKSVARVANPAIQGYDDKIAELKTSISETEAQVNDTRIRAATGLADLSRYGSLEHQQSDLEMAITRHRDAVTSLSKSVDDITMREKATHDPVLVITPAGVAKQIAPRKLNNLASAILVGLVLGLCFALLQEFLDDRINTPDEARKIIGAPAIGYIPLVENESARLLTSSHSGTLSETYRVLRSNVNFSAVDGPIRSLLVTSTLPGEGKSMTTYNLAIAMAIDGRKVILVDTDLRRPSIHKKAGLDRRPGLTNVLCGQMSVDDALQESGIPGLRIITAGPLPPNPAELLNSNTMREIHDQLMDRADIVMFDCPPCLGTADAQVMSAVVDGVIYVAQFGETKKSTLRRSAELLQQAKARIIGVVFNKIDLSGNRDDYYYGYYRYYNYYNSELIEEGDHLEGSMRRGVREYDQIFTQINRLPQLIDGKTEKETEETAV